MLRSSFLIYFFSISFIRFRRSALPISTKVYFFAPLSLLLCLDSWVAFEYWIRLFMGQHIYSHPQINFSPLLPTVLPTLFNSLKNTNFWLINMAFYIVFVSYNKLWFDGLFVSHPHIRFCVRDLMISVFAPRTDNASMAESNLIINHRLYLFIIGYSKTLCLGLSVSSSENCAQKFDFIIE